MEESDRSSSAQQIVLVTGPAGAGRNTAIRALEDLGFEAIDNLPLSLIPRLLAGPPVDRPLAIGADPRTRDFSAERLNELVEDLRAAPDLSMTLVYVDCDVDALLRRYNETRRRHPSSPHETPLVGIERDKVTMEPLRARADVLIDTTEMSPHDLRAEMARWFGGEPAGEMAVSVQSFSYKRETPRGADMVIDCRFLRNPHWVEALRPRDGRDPEVAAHIGEDPRYGPFLERLEDLMTFLLPAYQAEGKSYFSLALGCTGGRHRSVTVAEALANALAKAGWRVSIRHRDLERTVADGAAVQGTGTE